ncbi:hypothetical protein U732_53 [Clostridium argentinense CDC 2741]|uniref:Uncharacterized protein n=2 Tax=Clostridium argentinense TaxID=29341 RepID=A0A0C1UC57_9CLOT|nr:hypothetical protein [Clostridium argentinense]ARC83092.1 hypothetical protein RSJ17_00115 [Clostridium argentinense]KIE45135.1 hypothetical protein U732_53 [Clostridium argentinense CDC 2741]NFF41356.1 hypothetical protein [Clostridium argentinense]NFP51749.1 hypothetical protein [Clostridium argentinense]NFP74281.1 hypothetical protein [Clostridium argentinense]
MDNFKKRKILLLLTIPFILSLIIPPVIASAGSDGFGYALIRYHDSVTNEEIRPPETISANLNGASSINFPIEIKSVDGYRLGNVSGVVSKDPYTIKLTDKHSSSNPLQVFAMFSPVDTQVTVEIVLVGTNKTTGHVSEMDKRVLSVRKGELFKNTPPKTPMAGWVFKNAKLDGSTLKEGYGEVSFVPTQNCRLEYHYEISDLPIADLIVIAVDNELDKNGKVVIQPDRNDYFYRKQYDLKKVNQETSITVSSGGNGSKPELELAFVILEHHGGNPTTALTQNDGYLDKAETVTTKVRTDAKAWYVHFYWKPKGTDIKPPEGGEIVFDPNSTDWTNRGKTGEGSGSYQIAVKFTGQNPAQATGSATWEHSETPPPIELPDGGTFQPPPIISEYSSSFPVEFPLGSISVSGDTSASLPGEGGNVYITKEGEGLSLSATGSWESAKHDNPNPRDNNDRLIGTDIPDSPPEPTGQSGLYNIDWTKPDIYIDNPQSKWVKSPVPYPVRVSVDDSLSGFASGSVNVTDSSHYRRDNSDSLPYAQKSYNKTVMLSDGIYSIAVDAIDRATNDNADSKSTYYIDGTDPEVEFNIKPGIFSTENGAIRKPSKKGIDDGFYGELTASDNLSGVAKIQFGWTFENKKNDVEYEVIYTSPYTYTDRYQERIKKEIEKPVGDNLYLHIELWDTAGNYTYKVFGPYEDPIKLRDFRITDIRDPLWDSVFWKDSKLTEPTYKSYGVKELPIDENSHPTLKNAIPKKGYSFYFDITSEYLYRDKDRIEIIPTYYYFDGTNRIPVDCYYNLDNNPFILVGSSMDRVTLSMNTLKYGSVPIGYLPKLTLTKGVRIPKGREWLGDDGWKHKYPADVQYRDGKEQYWYGKYFIPATSVFVKQGDVPRPENILKDKKIIVNFQIVAYKNGVETLSSDQIFTYIPSQWKLEGGPKDTSKYEPGDVILYDNKYNTLSNFRTYIIH